MGLYENLTIKNKINTLREMKVSVYTQAQSYSFIIAAPMLLSCIFGIHIACVYLRELFQRARTL